MDTCNSYNYSDHTNALPPKDQSIDKRSDNLEQRGYEMALEEWLREARHFQQFKTRITEELRRIGLSDWAYSRLDIPVSVGIDDMVGTTSKKQLDRLKDIDCYGSDLTYQHIKHNRTAIFRSEATSFLGNGPLKTNAIENHLLIVREYEKLDFFDHYSVPIFEENKGVHANFTCSTMGLDSDSFVRIVRANSDKIDSIIKVIESVGIEKYSEFFIGRKIKFDKKLNDRSTKLLKLMAFKDYSISEAADALHMTRTAADKQLSKIRGNLGVNTTLAALLAAINEGLISPDVKTKKIII